MGKFQEHFVFLPNFDACFVLSGKVDTKNEFSSFFLLQKKNGGVIIILKKCPTIFPSVAEYVCDYTVWRFPWEFLKNPIADFRWKMCILDTFSAEIEASVYSRHQQCPTHAKTTMKLEKKKWTKKTKLTNKQNCLVSFYFFAKSKVSQGENAFFSQFTLVSS